MERQEENGGLERDMESPGRAALLGGILFGVVGVGFMYSCLRMDADYESFSKAYMAWSMIGGGVVGSLIGAGMSYVNVDNEGIS
jgi:hypothetical protein